MPLPQRIERLLIGLGAAFLLVFILFRIYSVAGARLGRLSFETRHSMGLNHRNPATPESSPVAGNVDFTLWSRKRIKAFQEAFASRFQPPLGVLKIPRIHLEVPVFDGTDEAVLNRGVGRIIGTAHVDGKGNVCIAGHRDGFFRALKDLKKGDSIEFITSRRKSLYQIETIIIVTPEDVHVLSDRAVPTITLVTCYPFYFVGDAPQRYVLQCSLKENSQLTAVGQSKATSPTQ
jgi:sortase A